MTKDTYEQKIALITGGNTGIGLAVVERLLLNDPSLRICLACRSRARAEAVQQKLAAVYQLATIDILLVDVANIKSVYEAAKIIKDRYHHLDYVYLNAGIMPVTTVDWSNFWKQLFSVNCIHMFATGDGLLKQQDSLTEDGLPQIFATNLFGHFVLIKELEDILGGNGGVTRIVWTSSSNASRRVFSIDDIEHRRGTEPYASSKYASDLVSLALNTRLNSKGIYSHTTCPGLVMTNLTYGILPSWIWMLFLPIMWFLRLLTSNMCVSPENGSEALVWLTRQEAQTLHSGSKFHSCVSATGKRYTKAKKMDIEHSLSQDVYNKLSAMEIHYRKKYNES